MPNRSHVAVDTRTNRDYILSKLEEVKGRGPKSAERKLRFIIMRYEEKDVAECCDAMGVSLQTGYSWQRDWNLRGIDFINPVGNRGRRPSMTPDQLSRFIDAVKETSPTTEGARELISERFGLDFTCKHVRSILRNNGFIQKRELFYVRVQENAVSRREKGRWVFKEDYITLLF